jgi:DNA-binding transcriptional regulator YhcF (GntR family)
MSQLATQIEPLIPRDTYPVLRVTVEYFLRGVEVLSQLHDDVVASLVFMTLWHGQMQAPGRGPVGIRELSRKLGMPYETVRRHVRTLVQGGLCIEEKGGLAVPPAAMRGPLAAAMLRRTYVNVVRVLRDLTRIGVARFSLGADRPLRSRRLTKEQTMIGIAGTGLLLTGYRELRKFAGGDLMKGLVFTAIWTANVKHVTNTSAAGDRAILQDSQRLPVSALAMARSLRLPYETVRRHADALLKEGQCVRVGRKGLVVMASTHQRNVPTSAAAYHIVMAFLAELRNAGVKV